MFRRGGKLSVLSSKDDRLKIIHERINLTEKHFAELCNAFRNVAQRSAKQRDTYDELAKCCKIYSDDEEINESLQEGLRSYANAITLLGDYLDIKVHRLESKLVNELSQYENVTKNVRDSLRSAISARDKEVLKQRQMLEIKTKFASNNSGADSELVKAKLEVNRTNKEIDELSMNFEQRKLENIKSILSDFILISMKYHTKALEVLSATYYDVSNIDEKGDLQELQNVLRIKQEQSNKLSALKLDLRSQSMDNLDTPQLINPLQRAAKLSKSKPNLVSDNSDEDEDDDESEEEEEEETEEDLEGEEDIQSSTESELSAVASPPNKNHFKATNRNQAATKALHKFSKTKQTFQATKPAKKAEKSRSRRSAFNSKKSTSKSTQEVRSAGRLVTLVESKQN